MKENGATQAVRNDQHQLDIGNPKDGKGDDSETPPLEWVIACVGLVLVVAALSLLLYNAIWGGTSPPVIAVRVIAVVPVQNGYLVQFETVNQGGSTAEGIVIEGDLRRGTEKIESSHTTVDYLPPNSRARGGLFFTQDPRQFDFHSRALGYEAP